MKKISALLLLIGFFVKVYADLGPPLDAEMEITYLVEMINKTEHSIMIQSAFSYNWDLKDFRKTTIIPPNGKVNLITRGRSEGLAEMRVLGYGHHPDIPKYIEFWINNNHSSFISKNIANDAEALRGKEVRTYNSGTSDIGIKNELFLLRGKSSLFSRGGPSSVRVIITFTPFVNCYN